MSEANKRYRTVFVGELVQETGLSTGGRDGDLYADAIMARDGQGRPLLRGSGLAGALLAVLDDFVVSIPDSISRRVPDQSRDEATAESLWLVHHAHLITESAQPMVRPNVAIHPWTGAAADGLYFSTEILPRGTRWRLIIETDDWRESEGSIQPANRLLALALREWVEGRCWLGRSPARGLGWAKLNNLQVFSLDARAASFWPNAGGDDADDAGNIKLLEKKVDVPGSGVALRTDLGEIIGKGMPKRFCKWRFYKGSIKVGEREGENGYGLDSLSTLARDFPADQEKWQAWGHETTNIDGHEVSADMELDSVPAWTQRPDGEIEFMVPGSAIRGALRSTLSAWWRRAGVQVWAPNGGYGEEPENSTEESEDADSDPLLPLFGSITKDSNLLVSDAWQKEDEPPPEIYIQDQHAEDEFTQGVYASAKFNRPCLISGKFEFRLAIRVREMQKSDWPSQDGKKKPREPHQCGLFCQSLENATKALELADALGSQRFLPIGGGIWRGHGWIQLRIQSEGGIGDAPAEADENAPEEVEA